MPARSTKASLGGDPGHGPRCGQHAGAHHSRGGAGAGLPRTDPAFRGPFVAAVYTPGVFLLALAVALLTPWAMGWGWMTALYKALVLLVIACPCALVISTPVTVVSGLAAGAGGDPDQGGVHLEGARQLRAVALDKTGTSPRAGQSWWPSVLDPNDDPAELEALARSLAARSDHPVSQAIAAKFTAATREVDGFQPWPGAVCGSDRTATIMSWPTTAGSRSVASAQRNSEAKMRVHEKRAAR